MVTNVQMSAQIFYCQVGNLFWDIEQHIDSSIMFY